MKIALTCAQKLTVSQFNLARGTTNRTNKVPEKLFFKLKERRWLGSQVVSVLDSGAEGPGFKSQWRRCRITVLGKLFTLYLYSPSSKIGSSPLKERG